MELNPIGSRRAPNEHQSIPLEMEENAVANNVAIVTAGGELFGSIDRKICESVGGEIGEHFERVGTFYVYVGHVVRLVKENGRLPPGALLVAPIGVFGRHHRIDVRADLRMAQQGHGVPNGLQEIFEAFLWHPGSHRDKVRVPWQFAVQHTERGPILQSYSE